MSDFKNIINDLENYQKTLGLGLENKEISLDEALNNLYQLDEKVQDLYDEVIPYIPLVDPSCE
jgi:hypothetical protein